MVKKALPVAGRVRRWRLPAGSSLPRGAAPLGVSTSSAMSEDLAEDDGVFCVPRAANLEDPWSIAEGLPDPATMPGRLIVLSPTVARSGFFARILGSDPSVPRPVRGSALLLRGFRDVGGGVDPKSGLDLAWGWAR